jgi:N-acetylglucosamine-6-phosphate deacetylase
MISSPETLYREALPRLAGLAREGVPGGAEVLGVHLEGPFVSPERKGAHPTGCIAPADADLLAELLGLGPVRMLTLAPELEGAAGSRKQPSGAGSLSPPATRTPRSRSPTRPLKGRSRA